MAPMIAGNFRFDVLASVWMMARTMAAEALVGQQRGEGAPIEVRVDQALSREIERIAGGTNAGRAARNVGAFASVRAGRGRPTCSHRSRVAP